MYDPNKVLSINNNPNVKYYTNIPRPSRPLPFYDLETMKSMIPYLRLNGLNNDSGDTQIQLSRLRYSYDYFERTEPFNLPILIPRLEWHEYDPFDFQLPIYIPDWTGQHERYIFLQYFIYTETEEEFSFESINYKIDTASDPNFGELGFRWIYLTPDTDLLFYNVLRYKIFYFCWFQENPRNDQQFITFTCRRDGNDHNLQST
ncbi:hypothetical protein M9Y10_034321 [Tritrichomonas musculus]|uniref:Uncharacterized protein n=1 Tax=Tritrichomonas musculus TaxID=1915356 RepID=A0ABR2KEN1_9EUKA